MARYTLSRPHPWMEVEFGRLSAVWQRSCFIAMGDWYVPFTERMRAAAPATCGVAIDVPAISTAQSTGASYHAEG